MTSPQDIVQLNAPTSRCFEILLANRYSVISQKVLFESVWGKQGAYVSANTLYQNISLLRKALKSLDLDGIVKTISKQGIVIADTVSVQEIENDNVDLEPIPIGIVYNDVKKRWNRYRLNYGNRLVNF
ncbi:hypothetical protein YERSI8AC_20001 [Enterobacterales bacterium 8AC]|nr:hypothetical protein YERSI8AC_20001 [Enterobacterales bacterium 8AC]